jgi:transcription elongation factor Elf1
MPIDTRPVNTSTTVTDITDDDPCPYCGGTSGVQPTPAPPKVQAWRCSTCGLDWACTVANPHQRTACLNDLVAAVAEIDRLRWGWRQIIALAEQAPTITDRDCGPGF